jgi:hypothetical protein
LRDFLEGILEFGFSDFYVILAHNCAQYDLIRPIGADRNICSFCKDSYAD